MWPSVGIVMTSAVDWLMSKVGTNFARNSKFHIRMTILCQLRDSVTPALEKKVKLSKHESILVTFLKRDEVVTIYSKF